MLAKLFGRLTEPGAEGAALFDALTREARQADWYRDGAVPDTIDGRFALLSTLTALALVRLDGLGDEGAALSVALTERFARVMESEHREMGLGDPTLGKTVLKLVGLLARRVDVWREAAPATPAWTEAAAISLPDADAKADKWRATRLADIYRDLASKNVVALAAGEI